MTAEFLRDAAATAAVFGFFASAWFGWARASRRRHGARRSSRARSFRC
jgi:hypothetical protein